MKIQFISKNSEAKTYQDLTPGNVYRVLGIEADDYRILSDDGLPYLYPPHLFSIIEKQEPEDWLTEYGEDGERYSYPSELNSTGFFEDYFDGDPQAILTFHQYLAKQRIINGSVSKAA